MRLSSSRATALTHRPQQDFPLWDKAGTRPSLDLQFADRRDLVDATTGSNLVDFTRASSGTYVGSDGLIKTAVTNFLLQSEDFSTTWITQAGLTVTANQIVSPDGTSTADLVEGNGVSIGYIEQQSSPGNQFITGLSYTFSVFLKKANTSTVVTLLYGATFNSGGSNAVTTWDLDTGVPSFTNGATGSMTDVGNGWYRCVVTVTATATETRNQQWLRMTNNSGDVYAWGAQLEQSTTVGEYVKTTSTINSAPRFDHDPTTGESLGLLVEESRTNLLLQSNRFDTTWTTTLLTATAAAGIAPDGANTAWQLLDTLDASPSNHILGQADLTFTSGTAYTVSMFAKQGTLGAVAAVFPAAMLGTATVAVKANLTNGTIITTAAGATNSITAYPNGWYRVTSTMTATASGTGLLQIRTAPLTGAGTSYQGDGNGTILIWGAQLEAGSFPTSYIPTTSSTVTRAADVASISGSNFSGWFNQGEGCIYSQWRATGSNQFAQVYQFHDNAATSNLIQVYRSNSDTTFVARIREADTTSNSLVFGGQNWLAPDNKVAASYATNDYAASANGSPIASDTSVNLANPSVLLFGAGQALAAANYLGGTIKRFTYWPQRLPNDTLQTITQ